MKSFVKFGSAIFALILLLRIARNTQHINAIVAGHFVSDWALLLGSVIAVFLAYALWSEVRR